MEFLTGRDTEPADAATLDALCAEHRAVLIDLGCGDGAFPYRVAAAHPDLLCIGVDANREAMAEYARRARRKPARGGVPNVRYVAAGIEALPPLLRGRASLLTVNFPWAGLLTAIVTGEAEAYAALRSLLTQDATLQILINADAPPEGVPPLELDAVRVAVEPALAAVQLSTTHVGWLSPDAHVPTTWGGRLMRGSGRRVIRMEAVVGQPPTGDASLLRTAIGLPA